MTILSDYIETKDIRGDERSPEYRIKIKKYLKMKALQMREVLEAEIDYPEVRVNRMLSEPEWRLKFRIILEFMMNFEINSTSGRLNNNWSSSSIPIKIDPWEVEDIPGETIKQHCYRYVEHFEKLFDSI